MEILLSFLPKNISNQISKIPPNQLKEIEEIRVRVNRPIEIAACGVVMFLPYTVQSEDAEHLLNKISQFSLYALEEELKRGYITIAGGHRVGLAGKLILENGVVKAIRDISSFNIRIASEKIGVANPLIHDIYITNWQHTLIIGAPQTGKTTILRDIARIISTGMDIGHIPASKVGIVDERSEIAGCVRGVPQLTFGPRVDVLDGCPKAEGMMMMIRSMCPEVLIVDEIGRMEDSHAIMEAVNAGIKLIMTTHGHTLEEIKKTSVYKDHLISKIFLSALLITRSNGPGTITIIFWMRKAKVRQ